MPPGWPLQTKNFSNHKKDAIAFWAKVLRRMANSAQVLVMGCEVGLSRGFSGKRAFCAGGKERRDVGVLLLVCLLPVQGRRAGTVSS